MLLSPVQIACVYTAVTIISMPLVLSLFNDKYTWSDVAIVAFSSSGIASLVPTIGGPLSLLVMLLALRWRIDADWFPDLATVVLVSRLGSIPALMYFDPRFHGGFQGG
jgi:hypothetical protein